MKKTRFFLSLGLATGLMFLASCQSDNDEPVVRPANIPASISDTGNVSAEILGKSSIRDVFTIEFKDFPKIAALEAAGQKWIGEVKLDISKLPVLRIETVKPTPIKNLTLTVAGKQYTFPEFNSPGGIDMGTAITADPKTLEMFKAIAAQLQSSGKSEINFQFDVEPGLAIKSDQDRLLFGCTMKFNMKEKM